jgi:hypothetical protein
LRFKKGRSAKAFAGGLTRRWSALAAAGRLCLGVGKIGPRHAAARVSGRCA